MIQSGGSVTNQPGHIIDVRATCLDVDRVRYPKTYKGRELIPLEGKSLLAIFKGKRRQGGHEAIYWEREGSRPVRQSKWKLVVAHGNPWGLYDLEAGRTELNILSDKYPHKIDQIKALYRSWAKRCGVLPCPIKKK